MKMTIDTAIRNAEASLSMEDLHPSQEILAECKRVLCGELSHEEYIKRVRAKYVKSAGTEYGKLQP
jgi:hypothetical protein